MPFTLDVLENTGQQTNEVTESTQIKYNSEKANNQNTAKQN